MTVITASRLILGDDAVWLYSRSWKTNFRGRRQKGVRLIEIRGSKESLKMLNRFYVVVPVVSIFVMMAGFVLSEAGSASVIQNSYSSVALPTPENGDKPAYSAYRGIGIGVSMEEARLKLGSPKDKSEVLDFFVFSDNESAQVLYDKDHKVYAISVTYVGNMDSVPAPKIVFGEDVDKTPDGGVHKLVRYPKAGYWISYTRTAGDDPLVIIAMQKM